MTTAELIEKLERADGPSRELDAEIAQTLSLPWDYAADWGPRGRDIPVAHRYTASIDAALTLVPEGWYWDYDGQIGAVRLYTKPFGKTSIGQAGTPAIALCIAALKAKEADNG